MGVILDTTGVALNYSGDDTLVSARRLLESEADLLRALSPPECAEELNAALINYADKGAALADTKRNYPDLASGAMFDVMGALSRLDRAYSAFTELTGLQ